MGKNAKYVVDKPKADAKYPPYRVKNDPKIVKPIVQVDADTVPGAEFYSETKWILPGSDKEVKLCESHTHDFNEVLGFFGFNYNNIVDRSFSACIPAGVQHGPVIIRNIKRPIFHVSSGPTGQYK